MSIYLLEVCSFVDDCSQRARCPKHGRFVDSSHPDYNPLTAYQGVEAPDIMILHELLLALFQEEIQVAEPDGVETLGQRR
jgi:hypothetical protein